MHDMCKDTVAALMHVIWVLTLSKVHRDMYACNDDHYVKSKQQLSCKTRQACHQMADPRTNSLGFALVCKQLVNNSKLVMVSHALCGRRCRDNGRGLSGQGSQAAVLL
jgi:hypothetical protein